MVKIGLFIDLLSQPYQNELLLGVQDECRRANASLYCFAGGQIDEPNSIYGLVGAGDLDGIVVSSGTAARNASAGLARFFARFDSMPSVSVSVEVGSVPCVLIDNVAGIRELTQHLIDAHARRRIAFVRVPHPEGELRFAGYEAALRSRGLPLDPELIVPGEFTWEAGVHAVRVLFDERKAECDAIVAASDWIAIGAMGALRQRGIAVPEQVAVTGFDDIDEARFSAPSITTVYQPVRELGATACRLTLEQIHAHEIPRVTRVSTRSEYRESCGCSSTDLLYPPLARLPLGQGLEGLQRQIADVSAALADAGSSLGQILPCDWPAQLLDALLGDLRSGGRDRLVSTLRAMLARAPRSKNLHLLQRVISTLRRAVTPYLEDDIALHRHAEFLCEQAHVTAAAEAERAQGRSHWNREHVMYVLNQLSADLRCAFDYDAAIQTLLRHFDRLDVPSCFVAVQPEARTPDSKARLILAYRAAAAPSETFQPRTFRSGDLLPAKYRPEQPHSMIVTPLWFGADASGFCVLEMGPANGLIYEMIRELSSAAFYAAHLLEAKVAETTRREKAERARLEEEMRLAAHIQTSMLPRIDQLEAFEFATAMRPAAHVGGDYFDVLPFDGGSWLGIGDVAGHGLDTGLIMMMIQASVSSATCQRPDASPVEIWRTVNSVLCDNVRRRLGRDEHATLMLLRCGLDGHVVYSGAHEDLLVFRAATRSVERFASAGIWAGIVPEPEEVQIEESELLLLPGDVLLLYTDGLSEAMNRDRAAFGIERLMLELESVGGRPIAEIRTHIIDVVQRWAPQLTDDRSLLALRYVGPSNSNIRARTTRS
jgi:phosphoserine phosphatase RsbU/P